MNDKNFGPYGVVAKVGDYELKVDLGRSFSEVARQAGRTLNELTEMLAASFAKQFNLTPSECEIVQESTSAGTRIYVRRREVAVAEQEVIRAAQRVRDRWKCNDISGPGGVRSLIEDELGPALAKLDEVKR